MHVASLAAVFLVWLLAAGVAVNAGTVLVGSLGRSFLVRRRRARGVRTEGVAVGCRSTGRPFPVAASLYGFPPIARGIRRYTRVRYTDRTGDRHLVEVPGAFEEGAPVPVVYPPARPQAARLDAEPERAGRAVVTAFCVAAVVTVVIPVLAAL